MSKGWPKGLRHCGIGGCRRRHGHDGPCIAAAPQRKAKKAKPSGRRAAKLKLPPDIDQRVRSAIVAAQAISLLTTERDRRMEAIRADFASRIAAFMEELEALMEPTATPHPPPTAPRR